ncbi:polysaccharide biosynthesis tyrosine autokinase [Flavobacterium sp.]|uniref:exopolysaccharide transport family protein n=1 Tax=Flavobacterium sp. TaxID=239 RepID=UPI0035288690
MLDVKDFNFADSAYSTSSFDFKGFLSKMLGYWKWFVFSIVIALLIAYNINIRQQKIYGLDASIVVRDENNSYFTSNTSLVFNWGGVSEKVQTVVTTLKSRTHNEKVVQKLHYYISYLKEGKYNLEDVYGQTPFTVTIDENKAQLLQVPIKIKFISETEYELSIDFKDKQSATIVYYNDNTKENIPIQNQMYNKKAVVNEKVQTPFLNFTLNIKPSAFNYVGSETYIQFENFDSVVSKYRNLSVSVDNQAQSVIKIGLSGTNKNRLVEYLNTTVKILKENQLQSKNKFATNTISFIDSTLVVMEGQLNDAEKELNEFRKGKNVFEMEVGGSTLTQQLSDYDVQKETINRKVSYLNHLKSYLQKDKGFASLPAPAVAGIEDPNILLNVSKLIQLSAQKDELSKTAKSAVYFEEINTEMNALKTVLLENIETAKAATQIDLGVINKVISKAENKVRVLPEQMQEHVKISRKYNLKDNLYSTFLQKRSEAEIVKASNVSDIEFIDSAKDIGGGLQGPKNDVNYILAIILGFLIPFFIVLIITLLDNNINTSEDIVRLTKIPVIGVIGKKISKDNLAVIKHPKSALAESFRALRTSLQYIYKRQDAEGAKIVMLTSSISGEGKTFCSMNLATVFALSEKKTIIVGLDLRKPKIFDDFNINNSVGVVNYLIKQKTLDEVIETTHIPYLDVISSGPIPPNPSELLMNEMMTQLINELKEKYEYIILDTPPVGLVSDALELTQYCDATLYVTRQGFTKKGMLAVVNEKHKRGELHNISIILNGYQNKAKYGYGGGGYVYGYGEYGESYLDQVREYTWWEKIKNKAKKSKK